MTLTTKQKELIVLMDKEAKQLLKHEDDEAFFISLTHKMPQIQDIMRSSSEGELNFYCECYEGFCQYMSLLERLTAASLRSSFYGV